MPAALGQETEKYHDYSKTDEMFPAHALAHGFLPCMHPSSLSLMIIYSLWPTFNPSCKCCFSHSLLHMFFICSPAALFPFITTHLTLWCFSDTTCARTTQPQMPITVSSRMHNPLYLKERESEPWIRETAGATLTSSGEE